MKTLIQIFLLIFAYSVTYGEAKPLKVPTTLSPQRIKVVVEGLSNDAREWGLSKSLIQSKVEQTLLGFNLEPSDDEPYLKGYLYVNVSLVGSAYNVAVVYERPVEIPQQSGYIYATVWDNTGTGIDTTRDKYEILSYLQEKTSIFATEYIKQNRKPTL